MFTLRRCTLRHGLLAAALLTLSTSTLAEVRKVPAQYPSIQAAVDAAGPGDVIKIKGNTYLEEVVIDGKSDLVIKGKGALLTGAFGGTPLVIKNSTDIQVRGLSITDSDGDGILAFGVDGLRLLGCKVFDSAFSGIVLLQCTGVEIKKCLVAGAVDHGIDTGETIYGSNNVTIKKTTIQDIEKTGILLNGDTFLVTGCKLTNVKGEGISNYFGSLASAATIEKNVIVIPPESGDANVAGGIRIRGINILIKKNKVTLPLKATCIAVYGMDITVQKNKTFGGQFGLGIYHEVNTIATEMYALNNKITGPKIAGINTTTEVLGAVIQGNMVKDSGRTGLNIWGTACQVIANTVKNAERYGMEAPEGANTYKGNVATGSGLCDLQSTEPENLTTNIYISNHLPIECWGS